MCAQTHSYYPNNYSISQVLRSLILSNDADAVNLVRKSSYFDEKMKVNKFAEVHQCLYAYRLTYGLWSFSQKDTFCLS